MVYAGFTLKAQFDSFAQQFRLFVKGETTHSMEVGSDPAGNITRINNAIASLPKALEKAEQTLQSLQEKVESAKAELLRPFPQEAELAEKLARLHEVDALLDMDEKGKDAPAQDTAVADRPRAATRMYADQPKRPSVLEKLKARQAEVAGHSAAAPIRAKEHTL